MSQSYERRINLFINIDGKQVSNNVKSINQEMNKIVNQQKLMTIGSKEYILAGEKIKQLKGILDEHRKGISNIASGWSFKGLAQGFNKYFGIVAAGVASVVGLVYKMNQAIEASNTFEDKLANLSAITGLTGSQLEWLGEKAKEMSTSTLESGINITKSADEIVDAFTKMGSARPDLLKNKDALAEVTKQALILSEAGKIDLDSAISAVAASMNQFNLGAAESSRIINVLAAGSLEGSAEINDLTGSLKNVGTVAADSNMTLEQTVSALEVLAEKQLKGEEAGTKLRGALLKLKDAGVGYASGTFQIGDAITDVNKKLAGMGSDMEKDAYKAKIFGIENITAGNILIQNTATFDRLTRAVTGTNAAMIQASKNTNTNAALMKQAKNEAHNAAIELGENLSPAMTTIYKAAGSVAKSLSNWLAVPMSDKLRSEQAEINNLVHSIISVNDNQKLRNGLLQELNTKYPQLLGNINSEKVTNEQLLGMLEDINKEYLKRIQIAVNEEDIKKNESESQKNWKDQRALIKQINQDYDRLVKNKKENATIDEKLAAIAKSTEDTMVGMTVNSQKQDVLAQMYKGKLNGLQERQNELGKEYNELLKERVTIDPEANKDNTGKAGVQPGNIVSKTDEAGGYKTTEEKKKAYDAEIKLLENANTEINARLIDQYNIQGWSDERFKFQQLLAEQSYLEEKKKLQLKWGQDTVAIDGQINDNRLKLKEQYYALVTERDNEFLGQVDESTKTEAQLLADSIDATSNSIDESFKKVDLAADKEKETLEKRAQTYKMVSDTIVSSLSEALSGSLDEYATYGDSLILMALQILKQMAPIWAAQIVGGSLATPDSILTGGLAGIAKFTAILAIMYGFIGAAEKSVKTKIANRKEAAGTENSYASGGFTDGDRIYRAGEAGTEWIMPAWMVKNPQMGQMVAGLEEMRRKRVVVKPEILAWTNIQGFAKGGYTSSFSAEAAGLDGSPLEGLLTIFGGGKGMTDKKQNKLLRRMAATLDGFGTSVTGITNGGSNSNFSQQAANLNGSSLEGLLSIFGGAKGVMDQKQNKLLERMAATLDRIERKDPTVSVEMYEKKSAIFNKITNSGLK